MAKEVIDEVLAIEGKFVANAVFIVLHGFADITHNRDTLLRGLFNGGQHIQHPFMPFSRITDVLQQTVVFAFVLYQIAAQIQHGYIQQAGKDKI